MVQALVYRVVRRQSPDLWKTRHVCASLPIIVVDTLDAIARDTGRSRSAVITDALLAHPAIESGCISGVLRARGIEVASDVPQIDGDDPDIAAALTALGVDDAG